MCYQSELHHAPDSFLEKVKGWGGVGGSVNRGNRSEELLMFVMKITEMISVC